MSDKFLSSGAMQAFPLAGKTVLHTRPKHSAGELTGLLRGLGAEVIEFPTLKIENCECSSELLAATDEVLGDIWIFITSVNALPAVENLVVNLRASEKRKGRIKFAVVGAETAKVLHRFWADNVFVPREETAEGLALEFVSFVKQSAVPPVSVVFVCGDTAGEKLPNILNKAGISVRSVIAYKSSLPDVEPSKFEKLLKVINAGEAKDIRLNCIVFTSSLAARNLIEILKRFIPDFSNSSQFTLLKAIPVAVIGEKTAETVEKLGLRLEIIPKRASMESLVQGIVNYFETVS